MKAGVGYRAVGMWEVGMSLNAIAAFLKVPSIEEDRDSTLMK